MESVKEDKYSDLGDPPGYTPREAATGPQVSKDSDSTRSKDTTFSDLLTITVDPNLLRKEIVTVLSTLENVCSAISFVRDIQPDIDLYRDLSNTAHRLYKDLFDLEQILATYSAPKSPNEPDNQLNLDPLLYKWTADCMICLLGLHACVETETGRIQDHLEKSNEDSIEDGDDEWTLVDQAEEGAVEVEPEKKSAITFTADWELWSYNEQLKTFRSDLNSRLPVLHADLGSYHTRDLFPNSNPFRTPSDPSLTGLRSATYALKDRLVIITQSITRWLESEKCPQSISREMGQLANDCAQFEGNLTTYLTNHGSEWIESLLAGNLSFNDFRKINRGIVMQWVRRLKHCTEEFDDIVTSNHPKPRSSFDTALANLKNAVNSTREIFGLKNVV